ncbi:MAG: 30S ribosomal protein S11 [Candidatus Woesebacteria bacterium GW2011_GWB1_38_5]|uniref:Multifunctional fusion protein n=1 Tax=Candidatus Woesebacteria bacterium GW2011_GWB1_38_5 TaxID=1618568 RepID=A0A0G0K5U5_9BACT|nr:MAG: 30S ribosomal protein S11 [Candidatus Woesebacteria bacterium GW2011_GWB1_38_5]
MARISGQELSEKDRVLYALTKIKGIGMSLSHKIMKDAGISEDKRMRDMSPEDISKITEAVEKYPVEGDLVRRVRGNITRLQQTGSYRGSRHSKNLPSRGQRTRHNARGFNNTLVTVTDENGQVISWSSSGNSGFKGTRKSTPYAATTAVEKALSKAKDEYGLKEVEIFVKGPGAGRDAALRSVRSANLKISMIADVTPIPHNGPRPKKKRRG